MPRYSAPLEDVLFVLEDVLDISGHRDLPGFSDLSSETLRAVLGEGARFCAEVLQPLNRPGDAQGCRLAADGTVTTPLGFPSAYAAYREGGWVGLSAPESVGGQNLPATLNAVMQEFVSSANLSFGMVPGLTQGAYAAILAHGTPEQKALYGPKLVSGLWTGTMNLTEPQCGTDLGLIRTRAEPKPDGSFALTGTKIFISAGEHDLAENIVHLVLARIDGAPAGTKGISLFLCPKFIPDADGRPGLRNAVTCRRLEHKMGIHANPTCEMGYDGATAWLVGEPNRGLAAMFTMMNEARLAVGVQGLAIAEVALQNAAAYARDRLQGRALTGAKSPDKPADPIIVHPDVRRALMTIRAVTLTGRALMLWTALQGDIQRRSPDPAARQAAEDHMGLMTPVVKGVLTDLGFHCAVEAQQLFGGHGYIADWGMEQFVRDARITMIYEGANGIQALDLVGRKLPKDGGRAIMAFLGEVGGFLKREAPNEALQPWLTPLKAGHGHLQQAVMWLMQNAMTRPDHAGAGATDMMHLLGLVAMGYMGARLAKAAQARIAADPSTAEAMAATILATRFFAERLLPETALRLARISAGADTIMALDADLF
ncbi:MAG: acyl-CoA dehydrogenase C-terminal domain-containing protein [Labrys sp. (in: a-proteobacteria)]|jgi:acyl-CoA dehydrogenase